MAVNKIKPHRRKLLKDNHYHNKFLIFDLDTSMKTELKYFYFSFIVIKILYSFIALFSDLTKIFI